MSGEVKDLKRCRNPTKRDVGVETGWESAGWVTSFEDISGAVPGELSEVELCKVYGASVPCGIPDGT